MKWDDERMSDGSFCTQAVMAWASGDDYGECRMTAEHDAFGTWMRLRIDRADPRVLISGELADGWKVQGTEPFYGNPFMTLRPGPGASPNAADGLEGWLVTVRGENRSIMYRIGKYLPDRGCYEAEWPD